MFVCLLVSRNTRDLFCEFWDPLSLEFVKLGASTNRLRIRWVLLQAFSSSTGYQSAAGGSSSSYAAYCIRSIVATRRSNRQTQPTQPADLVPVSAPVSTFHWLRDERAFSHAGPSAWNALPEDIHATSDSAVFRKQLETHYFGLAFNVCWFPFYCFTVWLVSGKALGLKGQRSKLGLGLYRVNSNTFELYECLLHCVQEKNTHLCFRLYLRRFLVDFYSFCTIRKRNEYPTIYLLAVLMT